MAFTTLLPNEDALPRQPRIMNFPLDIYAIHLMRYHDNKFGSHPCFRYYLYNIFMHHGSRAITNFSVKQSQEHNTPTTIRELHIYLQEIYTYNILEHVMHFIGHLHWTTTFWTLCKSELKNMITQLQCPTLFSTLNGGNTKWIDSMQLCKRITRG